MSDRGQLGGQLTQEADGDSNDSTATTSLVDDSRFHRGSDFELGGVALDLLG
jgi:hypothetical protein